MIHRRILLLLVAVAAVGQTARIAPGAILYLESGGRVVGEGEAFSNRVAVVPQGDNWLVVPTEDPGVGGLSGARGGEFVQALPDGAGGGGGPNVPPEIHYQMDITTPGTYQLYLRWANNQNVGGGGNSDSMFVDVMEIKDGGGGQADWYELVGNSGSFRWDAGGQAEINSAGAANNPITWDIASPGIYTFRVTQREDGSAVDAFVFQRSDLPAPVDFGPPPSLVAGPKPGYAQTLTADADSFVRLGGGQNDDNFGNFEQLYVKDSGTGSTTRKGYLRFDLSDVKGSIMDAQLQLEVTLNNNGGSDTTPNLYTVNVFALNDGVNDDWIEGAGETGVTGPTPPNPIIWENAPANNTNNNGLIGSDVTLLGQFLVPAINPDLDPDPVILSFANFQSDTPDAFIDFLNSSPDGLVTLILTRDGGSNNLGFASKEHATALAPTLVLNVAVPEPSTLALAVVALLGLGL